MEIKKRENHKIIVSKEAQERINNNQCPNCGKPKSEWIRRKDWRCCSEDCTNKYNKDMVIFGWPDIRTKVFRRDKYTCQTCKKFIEATNSEVVQLNGEWICQIKTLPREDEHYEYYASHNFVADHIKPIALGGDEWDMNNIQTLCLECNKIKTKKDSQDIAKLRSIIKKQKNNNLLVRL